MKRCLSLVLPLLFQAASAVIAQDPAFRPAEGLRPAAPAAATPAAPPVKDDTATAVSTMSSMDRLDSTYLLKKGDIVSVRIVEDTSQKAPLSLKVQASGNINAPFINLVPAVGKSCKEVAMYMKKELEKEHFKTATVIVSLEENAKSGAAGSALSGPAANFITIYGQVQRQGKYEITPEEELTCSQAILKAGGFSQFAKDTKVTVIRKYPKKGNVKIVVNLRDVMMKGKLDYDIPIRGGDVIIVDEKLVNF
jgi:protein involved in polysaccharide export with SLBB domain